TSEAAPLPGRSTARRVGARRGRGPSVAGIVTPANRGEAMRLPLVAFVLLLALPCGRLWSAPAPLPKQPRAPALSPLEMACRHVRVGMTDTELFALLAPFERIDWKVNRQLWTDGRMTVLVCLRDAPAGHLVVSAKDVMKDEKV